MTSSTTRNLRIVLFCNGERGFKVLEKLHELGHEVTVVGDRDVNDPDFVADMEYIAPDLFIVAGYSRIFKKPLLDVPRHGTWNCHAGPVPEYRGGSPLNWQIIDGKKEIWISLLEMDEGVDTGRLIAVYHFGLPNDGDIAYAHQEANDAFPEMIKAALTGLEVGDFFPKPQRVSDCSRPQRNDDMGEIDLSWDRERIRNFVRALTHPYPGAWIKLENGERLRIWEVS